MGLDRRQRDVLNVLVQWYFDATPARHAEYVRALRLNLANVHVHKVYLLQGFDDSLDTTFEARLRAAMDPDGALYDAKVHVVYLDRSGRLSSESALRFASTHLRGTTCLFTNLDIYFDDSLRLLKSDKIDLDTSHAYFLSRYEEPGSRDAVSQCSSEFVGSHDTIVFVPPVPAMLVPNTDFLIGSWGIENRLMWEFEQAGIRVRNPCLDVRSWHVHQTRRKTSWMPQVNIEYSSVAHPTTLFPSRYYPYHRDHRIPWTQAVLPLGAVLLIRGLASTLCLFSRADGIFGHAECDEPSPYMHFVWAPRSMPAETARELTLVPDNVTASGDVDLERILHAKQLPAGPVPHGPHRLVTRETGLCLTAIGGELLAHRPCGLNDLVASTCRPLEFAGAHNTMNMTWTGCAALPEVQTWRLQENRAVVQDAVKLMGDADDVCLVNMLWDVLAVAQGVACKAEHETLYWNVHWLHPLRVVL